MALTYVGGTSNTGTGASYTVSLNGTLTGGSNSSPSVGDLILVFTGEANGASVTSSCSGNTSGSYSTIRAHQNAADTYDANLDTFYKFAGSTPDTTLTITRGANNTTYGSATVVHVWRGADSDTPFNVTPTVASAANASTANPAAITPTAAGSMIVYCGHASQVAASGTAFTTQGTYPISVKCDGSTADSIVMASHYTAWTSGAYDPAAFAGSTTATTLGWVAVTIVLKPAVRSLTCSAGSYTYTGSSVTVSRNRSLSSSSGSYTYTGSSAVLTKGAALNHRSLTANSGAYTYTGSSVTLSRGRPLTASAGSYSYSGSTATIRRNRSLTSSAGSYTYTGSAATIRKGRSLSASSGSYTYSGQSASLSRGRPLTAQAGSYTLTGSSVGIAKLKQFSLTAQAGNYSYTGSTAILLLGRSLSASARSYAYSGSSAEITKGISGYTIIAEPGSYVITGSSATITGIVTSLSEASILAIAQAVWERGLPITTEPVVTYGATELTQRDLNAISHAVWSKTL